MLQTARIKIRDLKELKADDVIVPNNTITPLKKRKNAKSASSNKKLDLQEQDDKNIANIVSTNTVTTKSTTKKLIKYASKETPSNQKRIDSYFTSCPKTYEIKFPKTEQEETTPFGKSKSQTTSKKTWNSTIKAKNNRKSTRRQKTGRKRLFTDSTEPSTESMSVLSSIKEINHLPTEECITIDSDSEDELNIKTEVASPAAAATKTQTPPNTSVSTTERKQTTPAANSTTSQTRSSGADSSLTFGLRMSKTSCENATKTTSETPSAATNVSRRKCKPCPPYKIIENTTFAVDAFQFGYIENVTHYFLTHFHADHYIGLTKSFAMPLYMSPVTARLLRTFISVQEQYIHEMDLNQPYIIDNIEITALDANHCPGAILLVFKFLDTGKCLLHTGDFRAWHGMESEPIFWNNDIHTIYLDTTYISDKYAFCTQYESIIKAQDLIEKFHCKHPGKRILYICGSYIIGKEKFWSELAVMFDLKVWAEGNRFKALKAINEEHINRLLVEDPSEANMHVIAMGKLTYFELVEYFKLYEHQYDIIFAIRPSGWEKNAKPRYGNKINIVGIEYSEHSSYAEMQRFVKFIKPQHVISTVPTGKDLMKTAKVPLNWYKYDKLKCSSNYQPSIDTFLGKTRQRKSTVRMPNITKGGVENFVSPLKSLTSTQNKINNSLVDDTVISINSKCKETEVVCNNSRNEISSCSKSKQSRSLQNQKNSSETEINNGQETEKTFNNIETEPYNSKSSQTKNSTGNSSQEFDRPDVVLTTKRSPAGKQKMQCTKTKVNKAEIIVHERKKLKRIEKELQEKNLNIQTKRNNNDTCKGKEQLKDINSTVKLATQDMQENLGMASEIEKVTQTNNNKSEVSSTGKNLYRQQSCCNNNKISNEENSLKTKDFLLLEDEFQVIRHLKTRSQTSSSKISTKTLTTEQKQNKEIFISQEGIITSKNNDDKFENVLLSISQQNKPSNEEISLSQKRMTRSKSNSSKSTTKSFFDLQNTEDKFETDLLKISQENNKRNNNTKSQLKTTTTLLSKTQENPICKSTTTTTSIDSLNDNEIQATGNFLQSLNASHTKPNSPLVASENSCDEMDYMKKSPGKSKRPLLIKHNLTPFKKAKESLDTKTILNTILETNEGIDRFNCSQLAGLVVDTLSKHNPDNSKDHIPLELLSDADDDWM